MFSDTTLFEKLVEALPSKAAAVQSGVIRKNELFNASVLRQKVIDAPTTEDAQFLLHSLLNRYDKNELLQFSDQITATFSFEGRVYHYFLTDRRTGRPSLLYILVHMFTHSGQEGLPSWIDDSIADRMGVAVDVNSDGELDEDELDAGCSFGEILELVNAGKLNRAVSLLEQAIAVRDQLEDVEVEESERSQEVEILVRSGDALPANIERTPLNLFEHQGAAIERLNRWWSDPTRRGGILCLPTGGGKTKTAAAFVHGLRRQNQRLRVLWLAHRKELIDQAFTALVQTSPIGDQFSIGRFEAGATKLIGPCDIVVASIDTLKVNKKLDEQDSSREFKNLDLLLQRQGRWFDVVVVDECHHVPASGWMGMLKEIRRRAPRTRFLGLSATPTRTNLVEKKQLHALLGDIEYQVTVAELIRKRILARPVIRPINTARKFSMTSKQVEFCNQFQEFSPELINMVARDEARNKTITDLYKKNLNEFGQTLFFAANLEHATELRRLIGIETAFIVDGKTERTVRRNAIDAFSSRRVRALINVGVFTEGTDLPGVESVFLTAFTKSEIKFRQMVGRGLRGPRLGGTEECKIVAFQDLFEYNGSRFDAGFEAGDDYLRALGIDPNDLEEVITADAGAGLDDEDSDDVIDLVEDDGEPDEETIDWIRQYAQLQMKLQEATNFFRGLPLTEGSWEPPAHMPLKGFFCVASEQGDILIPVFSDDEAELQRRVHELWTYGKAREEGPAVKQLVWVTPALWGRFRDAAAVALVPPKYEEFVNLAPQQALDYANALLVRHEERSDILGSPDATAGFDDVRAWGGAVSEAITRLAARLRDAAATGFSFNDVSVSAEEASALREVWSCAPELGTLGKSAVPLVTRLCQRELGAGGIHDAERARLLLDTCVEAGGAPGESAAWSGQPQSVPQRPALTDLRAELRNLSRSEGIELVKAIHASWYQDEYATHDELMYEILVS
jgi:superfamily II DNA or RNA helicase